MAAERSRPFTIAHRAGNDLRRLHRAVDAGVDFVEADLRWDGEPVLRHERRLPLLPLYWDRWYVRWDAHRTLTLASALDRLQDSCARPYLDIKSSTRRTLSALVEVLRAHDSLTTAEISTRRWRALEWLRSRAPDLRLFRSVGSASQLTALLPMLDGDPLRPAGVAIDLDLLTPALVATFRDQGLEVYVWGVRERLEAQRTLDWGATGIIADNLELLRSLKDA